MSRQEVAKRVEESSRRLWGHVVGNNKRSGRKVLRKALKADRVTDWYPATMSELRPHGYDVPEIEALYRMEQELNRVGKTRIQGKLKPLRDDVELRIKFSDFNQDLPDASEIAQRYDRKVKRDAAAAAAAPAQPIPDDADVDIDIAVDDTVVVATDDPVAEPTDKAVEE